MSAISSSSNNNNNRTGTRKRRRGHGLFGLVCVSLCASSTTGFVNQPQQSLHQQSSSAMSAISSTSAFLELEGSNMNQENQIKSRRRKRSPALRLTPEEEIELLRLAVEYRRLNQLEKDLAAMNHLNKNSLPQLSVRANAAGYGEQLDEYEDAMYEGQLARDTLVTHNMGLVHYCVNQIIGKDFDNNNNNSNKGLPLNSLSREDLIQEGSIGLARAVDKWNPEIGGKFSTYAVYWVRAAVLRCIAERDDVVRVPNHVSQAVLQINKAAKRLGWVLQESGGILVTEDANTGSSVLTSSTSTSNNNKRLAEEAGLSERHFEEAMTVRRRRYSGGYVPFESWMQKTNKSTSSRSTNFQVQHSSHHTDENEDHDRQHLESSVANEEIRTVLSKHLRPKEMEALSWRYGLLQEEQNKSQQQQQEQESIRDRANRQFLEMEDQLFGSAAAVAVTVTAAAAASSTTIKAAASMVVNVNNKAKAVTTKTATTASPPIVARGRFGEAMTFTEVGKKMQVSAEHTRRLCHKALNKLQQAAEDGTLEPAFLC